MRYIKQEGFAEKIEKIKSPFVCHNAYGDRKILFGDDQLTLEPFGSMQPLPLATFNCNEILSLPTMEEYVKNDVWSLAEPYTWNNGQVQDLHYYLSASSKRIFSDEYNTFRFCKNLIIRNIPPTGMRLHFFGDIFEYRYFYLDYDDVKNFHKSLMGENLGGRSRKDSKTKYISINHSFKDEPHVTHFLDKVTSLYGRIYKKRIKSPHSDDKEEFKTKEGKYLSEKFGINQINSKYGNGFKTIKEERLKNFYDLGHVMQDGKGYTKNFLLSCLICDSDKVSLFNTNRLALGQIREEFLKFNKDGRYLCIEEFFNDYDVTLKPSSNNNLEIEFVPTKYSRLQGSLLVPNPKFVLLKIILNQLAKVNNYIGSLEDSFHFVKDYHPFKVVTVKKDSVLVRSPKKRSFDYEIKVLPRDEYDKESFCNMIEI